MNPVAFDENAIGPSLVLTVADTILQTATSVDAHRMARSRYPAQQASTVEFYFYSPNAAEPSLVPGHGGIPPLSLGFCTKDAALDEGLGRDPYGWSWCPGDGAVRNAGSVIDNWPTAPLDTFVSMSIDIVAREATFAIGDTVVGTIALPDGFIYYAATVSGDPGDLAVMANGGQTPQNHATHAGGWFRFATGLSPLYLATEDFISAPTDDHPNQQYSGDIDRSSSPIIISRGIEPWMHGESRPPAMGGGTQIEISILDPNNEYGGLRKPGIRDQLVQIKRGAQGDTVANFEDVFTGVIDHCEPPTDQRKTLYATGKKAQLQTQMVRAMFPPNADPSVRGKPRPCHEGICRNYIPPYFKPLNVAATDQPISAFGKIRIGGVEKALGIDVIVAANGEDAILSEEAKENVLFETTTFGGAYTPDATDLLDGDGEFSTAGTKGGGQTATSGSSFAVATGSKAFVVGTGKPFVHNSMVRATSSGSGAFMDGTVSAYSGSTLTIAVTSVSGAGTHNDWLITGGVNQPSDWIGGGGYPTSPANEIFQVVNSGGNRYIHQEQVAAAIFWMKHATMIVQPGQSIAYEIDVRTAPYTGPAKDPGTGAPMTITPAFFLFGGMASASLQFWAWEKVAVATVGVYRGAFTNTQATALPLVFGNLCNALIDGSGGKFSALDINHIRVVGLPNVTQNVEFTGGPGLDWMLRAFLIGRGTRRGPLTLADYDPSGAQALDAETGYVFGLGIGSNETPQVSDCAQRLTTSTGGDLYETRDGRIGYARLIAPETVADADLKFDLGMSDFEGDLEQFPDRAENLTTRISGGPNGDPQSTSDYGDATLSAVPQVTRTMLQQPFQWTKAGGVPVAACYASAERADPLPSQFDREVDGQAEATRICTIYKDERNFYQVTVKTPRGTLLDIGQVGRITYNPLVIDAQGNKKALFANEPLAAGIKVQILWMVEQPSEGTSIVIFWGL